MQVTPPEPDTKSSESLTPLSTLLDESGTTSLDFEGTHFVQTPFLSNREQVLFSRSSVLPNEGDTVSPDSLLYLKKFYIRETAQDGILSDLVQHYVFEKIIRFSFVGLPKVLCQMNSSDIVCMM